eukprot:2683793-Karenia_brevis.AAC.1
MQQYIEIITVAKATKPSSHPPSIAGGDSVPTMSTSFSAPASSSQQNMSGYNLSAPSGWTSEDKSNYIA